MPDRIVRAAILDSRAFNELTDEAEVLYRRLLSVVDDFGAYEADPELIQIKCFWRKKAAWPPGRIDRVLAEICIPVNSGGDPLARVFSENGKRYLRIYNLGKPRALKPKYPLPPEDRCKQTLADVGVCQQTQADVDRRLQTPTDANTCKQTLASAESVRYSTTTTTTTTNKEDLKWEEFKRLYPSHRFDEARACQAWVSKDGEGDAILAGLKAWVGADPWKEHGGKFVNKASNFIFEEIYKMKPQGEQQSPAPPKPWKADW